MHNAFRSVPSVRPCDKLGATLGYGVKRLHSYCQCLHLHHPGESTVRVACYRIIPPA